MEEKESELALRLKTLEQALLTLFNIPNWSRGRPPCLPDFLQGHQIGKEA
jgi:hypothetical protein